MRPGNILVACSVFAAAVVSAPVIGAEPTDDSGAFAYPVRPGESLSDVSRIFGVPVSELAARNRLSDVNRLQSGQVLRIPNPFAREAAALRSERDRLLAEKARTERESTRLEQVAGELEARVRRLEEEKAALAAELAAVGRWRKTAQSLVVALLAVFAWALKARAGQIQLRRRLAALSAQVTALSVSKDRYRQAVSQLELKYQQLYRGPAERKDEIVADGIARLERTFREGSADIERLLARAAELVPKTEEPSPNGSLWLPRGLRARVHPKPRTS